jgi:hypothetical protein
MHEHGDAVPAALAHAGRAICDELDASHSSQAWQAVLEDLSRSQRLKAAAVWAAIRDDGGLKMTPYGLLVGTAERVADVFSDDSTYSVCEYGVRMAQSLGLLYLGLNGGLTYAQSSRAPNDFIRRISRRAGFERALDTANRILDTAHVPPSSDGAPPRQTLSLQVFADQVVGTLASEWFGAPDVAEAADANVRVVIGSLPVDNALVFPADFRLASEFIFEPRPSEGLAAEVSQRRPTVEEIAKRFTQNRRDAVKRGHKKATLIDHLLSANYGSDDEISRAWLGAVNGFSAPTGGSFLSVMTQWIERKQLWRLQQQLRREQRRDSGWPACLEKPLLAALCQAPVPDLLHRELARDRTFELTRSDGTKERMLVPARTRVVVSLASAVADQATSDAPPWILFGGAVENRRPPEDEGPDAQCRPRHPCPGREQAIGVILGMLVAILRKRDLRDEGNLRLSYIHEHAQGSNGGIPTSQ